MGLHARLCDSLWPCPICTFMGGHQAMLSLAVLSGAAMDICMQISLCSQSFEICNAFLVALTKYSMETT